MKTNKTYLDSLKVQNQIESRYDFEDMTKWALQDLKDINVFIFENPNLLKRLSNEEYDLKAFLYALPVPHNYQLICAHNALTPIILMHECVHIKQFERGDLKRVENEYFWKGEKYDNSIPYKSRPWEIEAFSLENKMWKDYKKDLKSI